MALSAGDLFKQCEFWILLFILGLVMLNWPIMDLASGGSNIFGFPFILAYIVAVWSSIILLIFVFDRRGQE